MAEQWTVNDMAKVLITSEYFGRFTNEAKEILLSAGHEVLDNPYGHKFLTPEEIIPYINDADAIICDLERINKDVINAAPRLKIIARRGVGVDSVDVEYAKQKGIEVARTLNVVEPPVAELVMSYILSFGRKIRELDAEMKKGRWNKILGSSIDEKTLGIIGMGKIAQEVAKRAKAFNMNIVYTDIVRNEFVEKEYGAVYSDLDMLLASADYVTIHTPLTPETNKLFNYEKLCKMKPAAYLINTARGAIIDEEGLYKALKEGHLAGAAIDVFDVEPKEDSILREMDNVILTPHVGTFTKEIFIKMDILAAKNIVNYFDI